jgi:hypothetical protein
MGLRGALMLKVGHGPLILESLLIVDLSLHPKLRIPGMRLPRPVAAMCPYQTHLLLEMMVAMVAGVVVIVVLT